MREDNSNRAARFFAKAIAILLISTLPLTSIGAQKFSISVSGQAQPIITHSSGSSLGVVPETGELVQEVLNAKLNLGSDSSFMSIDDPVPGSYSVTLHGSYEENITITLLLVDSALAINEEITLLALFHGVPISFTFTIDAQAEQALVVLPAISTVTNLSFEDNNGLGRLTWSASADPNIASYKVYGKSPQDAFFAPIVDVTALFYDSGHPVRTDDTGVKWDYIVTGIANDGSESFYDTVLDNRLRVRAFFGANQRIGLAPFSVQFTDESIGNPTSWQWDFNGDNVVDSTEQNPEYTFTAAGDYSVSLTIAGPIGTDKNTQNSYIAVDVDTDGDGLSDSYEILLGLNPNLVDTDGDGLVDGQGGVVTVVNYPGGIDLDLDGFVDGEQDFGTDPVVSNLGDVAPRGSPDNLIDLADLLVLTRMVTGAILPTGIEAVLSDINGDTQLNAPDILLLQRAVLNGTAP